MSVSENPSVLFNNVFWYECPGGGPRTKHVGIVVCLLLGYSPASEFYVPTFRNTLSHLHRQVMEQTECSETSAHKIQTPGNNPEESIQPLEHGESLKSRMLELMCNEE